MALDDNVVLQVSMAIITGIITFGALFGAYHLLDVKRRIERRPVLEISPGDNPDVHYKDIELYMYDVSTSDLPLEYISVAKFSLSYRVNRIKVRNNGNSAAEECKGIIIQKGVEMKVCWSVPSERHKMTINAKSHEFLDACGFLTGDPEDIAKSLKEKVRSLPEDYKSRTGETTIFAGVSNLKHEFLEPYKTDKNNDRLIEKHIPNIIAPTESDWQHPPNRNWLLNPGDASIRITCKNAAPIEYSIRILDKPEENKKIIKVEEKIIIDHNFWKTKSLVMKH